MINEEENSKDAPFSLNTKNLKMELLLFKDEVLKDIKSMHKIINDKFNNTNNFLKEKLDSYDMKLNLYNEKIVKLSNLISEDKNLKGNIDKLMESKIAFENNILTHDVKLNNIEKDYNNKITQINSILSDSIIYPNVIGGISKFKTFHDFIDYVLAQIIKINTYKEKNTLDLNSYKVKLENLTKRLQMQIDNIIKSSNEFTTKSVNQCEEKIKSILSLYDERFQNVRVENQSYAINLEQYYNDLKEEFKKFINIKNNIYNKFNSEVNNIKKDNLQVVKSFGNYKREFNLIKDRFSKLSDFIKDVRFRKNIGEEVKRKEFKEMGNKIDFTKSQNYDVTSGIKRYIQGEINAEDLTSLKKFNKANILSFEDEYNKTNDSMINNNLSKNINLRKSFFNNENNDSFNSSPFNNKIESPNSHKRKSLSSLMNPFSLNKKNSQNEEKKIKRNSLINSVDSFLNIIQNENKTSNSNDIKNTKRYANVMDDNIISQIQKNLDLTKINNKEVENSKYNNQRPIIKEENETISNLSKSNKSLNSNYKNIMDNKLDNNEKIKEKDNIDNINEISEIKIDKNALENKNEIIENDNKDLDNKNGITMINMDKKDLENKNKIIENDKIDSDNKNEIVIKIDKKDLENRDKIFKNDNKNPNKNEIKIEDNEELGKNEDKIGNNIIKIKNTEEELPKGKKNDNISNIQNKEKLFKNKSCSNIFTKKNIIQKDNNLNKIKEKDLKQIDNIKIDCSQKKYKDANKKEIKDNNNEQSNYNLAKFEFKKNNILNIKQKDLIDNLDNKKK